MSRAAGSSPASPSPTISPGLPGLGPRSIIRSASRMAASVLGRLRLATALSVSTARSFPACRKVPPVGFTAPAADRRPLAQLVPERLAAVHAAIPTRGHKQAELGGHDPNWPALRDTRGEGPGRLVRPHLAPEVLPGWQSKFKCLCAVAARRASALRRSPCRSSSDISGSNTWATPCRPRTLGKESVTPSRELKDPMGITACSSRNTISAMRAQTIPMPCWLAPMPSMIAILAKRTSRSISRQSSSRF